MVAPQASRTTRKRKADVDDDGASGTDEAHQAADSINKDAPDDGAASRQHIQAIVKRIKVDDTAQNDESAFTTLPAIVSMAEQGTFQLEMTVDLSTFTDTPRLLIQVPISGNMFVTTQDWHTPAPALAVPARAPAAASATMTQRVRAAPADVPSASSRPVAFTTSASVHPAAAMAPRVKTEFAAEMHADEVAATAKQAVTGIFRGYKREHHNVVASILFLAALVGCAAMVAFAPTGPAHQSTNSGFKQWVKPLVEASPYFVHCFIYMSLYGVIFMVVFRRLAGLAIWGALALLAGSWATWSLSFAWDSIANNSKLPFGEIALTVLIQVAIGAAPALILYLFRGSVNARIRLLELACGVIEGRGVAFGAIIAVSTVLDLVACTATLAFLPRAAAFSTLFVSDTLRVSSMMLYIFVCYWLIATVQVMTEFLVACITAHYFFREAQGSDEVWRFLRAASAASFGSMCAIGALKATSAFVSFLMRLLKRVEKSFLGGLVSSFIVPLIRFCQAFLELFSSEAIVQIAVHGCSLSEAGRKVTEQASLKSLLSLGILVHTIVFLCNAVGVAIASYMVLPRIMQREEFKESYTVLLLIIAFCYFVANEYSSLVARILIVINRCALMVSASNAQSDIPPSLREKSNELISAL